MKKRRFKKKTICVDCVGEIISYLSRPKELLKLLRLNKYTKYCIEHVIYYSFKHIVFTIKRFPKLPKKYVYYIMNMKKCLYVDRCVKKIFPNIKIVYFPYNTSITDRGLQYLKGIQILCLNSNKNITDGGLKYLKGTQSINLDSNINITDGGLKYIKGTQSINLFENRKITDHGLQYLKGIQSLDLTKNENITDQGLHHLKGIQCLYLKENTKITVQGLRCLKGIKHCHVRPSIQDEVLRYFNISYNEFEVV